MWRGGQSSFSIRYYKCEQYVSLIGKQKRGQEEAGWPCCSWVTQKDGSWSERWSSWTASSVEWFPPTSSSAGRVETCQRSVVPVGLIKCVAFNFSMFPFSFTAHKRCGLRSAVFHLPLTIVKAANSLPHLTGLTMQLIKVAIDRTSMLFDKYIYLCLINYL